MTPRLFSGGREEPDGLDLSNQVLDQDTGGGDREVKGSVNQVTGKTHNWKQMLIKIATFRDQMP